MSSAVLYLRVSTEEQVSNLSLDTQEQECRAVCARKGWDVAEVFREEGASAKTLERREMQRLLAYLGRARGRVGFVVVLRVDRLSRNREDFYLLRHALGRHGVRIVSAREDIADDSISSIIVETFSVLQAQVDNLIRSGRAKAGMREAARRGRWVWKAPVGYQHGAHVNGRPTGLELDPVQAPLVARAFQLVAGGASVDAAFRECVGAGMESRPGRAVGRQTFHALFRRPLYCGRMSIASWGFEGSSSAPAIVSEDLWAQARHQLAGRSPARRESATLEDFPLRGVARCCCGRRLAAFHARGKSGRRWPYYRCQRCRIQVSSTNIEAAFARMLGRLAVPPEVLELVDDRIRALLQAEREESGAAASAARRRLAGVEERLERLLEMRLGGEIAGEEYVARRERLEADRDAVRVELADLARPAVDFAAASAWQRELLADPASSWQGLERGKRPAFVEQLFPAGIEWSGADFSNPRGSLLQLPSEDFEMSWGGLVRQPGADSNPEIEPGAGVLGRLIAWRQGLVRLEAIVIGRAA